MKKSVQLRIDSLNEEHEKNNQFVMDNSDLPTNTLIELHAKQLKIENVIGWLTNIENYNFPKRVIPIAN